MYEHLTKHNLLSIHQSGFRPHHSCDTALIKLTDSLVTNMDKGLISGLNLTDYRKTFDLVDHATLFKKLFIYAISGRSPQWFNWYLKDRKQRVMIQRRLSSPQSTTTGVPQGSILGPLLFILFVNDLPLDVSKSTVKIYADDTTQVAFGRTVKEVETILARELRQSTIWYYQRLGLEWPKTAMPTGFDQLGAGTNSQKTLKRPSRSVHFPWNLTIIFTTIVCK